MEFWILKPTSLDLQLMTFGSKTLMLGCKNRSFWDAKSMILGSEIDLGASWGDLWPILAPRSSLGGSCGQSRILGRLLGPLFGAPKRSKSMKNFQKHYIFEMDCWLNFRWILVPTWAQLGPNRTEIGPRAIPSPTKLAFDF